MSELKTKANISYTGLRLIFILRELLKRPLKKSELVNLINSNPILYSVSQDTVAIDINTLREGGIKILEPHKGSDYKYVITKHPFGLKITENNLKKLSAVKDVVLDVLDWRYIVELYKVFLKLGEYLPENLRFEFCDFGYFNSVDLNILAKLERYCEENLEIGVLYDSKNTCKKEIKLTVDKIEYDNSKLYLWGYSSQYKDEVYLKIAQIKKITFVRINSNKKEVSEKTATYKIWGEAALNFIPKDSQTILEEGEQYLIIREKIHNEFCFIQKILSYGLECKILEPDEYKKKLLKVLKEVCEV